MTANLWQSVELHCVDGFADAGTSGRENQPGSHSENCLAGHTAPATVDGPAILEVPTMRFELPALVSKGIEIHTYWRYSIQKEELADGVFRGARTPTRWSWVAAVQFEVKVIETKTGELKSDTGLRPADSFVQVGKPVIPIAGQIAIDKLPSGSHRLEVQGSDSAGNRTDWRSASFTVE